MINFGWIKLICIKDCETVSISNNTKVYCDEVYHTDYYSDENDFVSLRNEDKEWLGLFEKRFFLTETQYRDYIIDKILNND